MVGDEAQDVQRLSAEILARARREAEEVRQAARAKADQILAQARQAAEREAQQLLAGAEKEAQTAILQAASTAEVTAQRLVLEAREKLIDQALDAAWQQVVGLADAGQRQRSLLALVVEAVAALGGGDVQLRLNSQDRTLVTPAFLAEAHGLLARAGLQANLTVASEPEPIAGGVITAKEGGRLLFDNSFEARLDRQREALRVEIWRVLAGERRRAAAA